MSEQGTEATEQSQKDVQLARDVPRSLAIAERGIRTGNDFADLMSAVMSDLISGRTSPVVGNAVCNAGGKLLKIVEMQMKYGKPPGGGTQDDKVLTLTASA